MLNTETIAGAKGEVLTVPIRAASGKAIYEVGKIIKELKVDSAATQAASAVMDKLAGKLLDFIDKEKSGGNISGALQEAVLAAFVAGKISFAEIIEMNSGAPVDEDTLAANHRILLNVFVAIIDQTRIAEHVEDKQVQKQLQSVTALYEHYPLSPIIKVAENFLRRAGLK